MGTHIFASIFVWYTPKVAANFMSRDELHDNLTKIWQLLQHHVLGWCKKGQQIVYFSDVFIFHFISYDDMNKSVQKREQARLNFKN